MTPGEKERYSRQILFAPIGEAGQTKLLDAFVCIVGCGALGSLQAEALARAGIGHVRLIDRDYVDYTNLQRQWLFTEADAQNESPKAIAAYGRALCSRRSSVRHASQVAGPLEDLSVCTRRPSAVNYSQSRLASGMSYRFAQN